MLRAAPVIIVLVATGCTASNDPLDPNRRNVAGEAATEAVSSGPIYLALAGIYPQLATIVTGTRSSFVVDGTLASASSGIIRLSGAGTTAGDTLEMHATAELVAWQNEFWQVTLNGSLDSIETATFGDPDAPLPTALHQHVTGVLALSGLANGQHVFDIEVCLGGTGQPFGYHRFGLTGTVDGEPAVDQVQGFIRGVNQRTEGS
ncbi:hypothetical protein BH11MYX1_BH11MYX1_38190 [soil metagenome]